MGGRRPAGVNEKGAGIPRRRVLLTGASGFIGTSLVASLDPEAWEVLNYDTAAPLDASQRVTWRQGDIMDPASLDEIMKVD